MKKKSGRSSPSSRGKSSKAGPGPQSPHHAHMRHASRMTQDEARAKPLFEVRRSGIHGRGVYATQRIPKGTRIVEYLGDRISHEEADDRYAAKGQDDGHTFLFVVSDEVVIDAGVGGNAARFINHSCKPNCDTVIEDERVFIEALRTIAPGEELAYEYGLTWESTDDPEELANYACRCGAPTCRGTMLDEEPVDRKSPGTRRKAAPRKESSGRPGKSRRA
jgi:SET domain-containing protein